MVNFENETTVATPAKDVMKIYLLQCKAFAEDTWRKYRKIYYNGNASSLADCKAAVEQLYIVMKPMLDRHWDDKTMLKENILNEIEKGKDREILQIMIKLNYILDKMNLTRLDTTQGRERTFEKQNVKKGFV